VGEDSEKAAKIQITEGGAWRCKGLGF